MLQLFAPAVKEGEPTKARQQASRSDVFAVAVWIVVFVFWGIALLHNWSIATGELKLPDVPNGIMALLAALPVSKAVTFLRR